MRGSASANRYGDGVARTAWVPVVCHSTSGTVVQFEPDSADDGDRGAAGEHI